MEFSILGLRLKNAKDDISFANSSIDLLPTLDALASFSVCKNDNGLDATTNPISSPEDVRPHSDEDEDEDENENSDDEHCDCEYEIYTRIETHMSISASLYILNIQGCDIVKELDTKKLIKKEQKVYTSESGRIYIELSQCVNANRMLCDQYTNLISLLDDVLFEECGELDTFYVKEDEYTLESLYYKQGSWVSEIEWNPPQMFEFTKSQELDEGECMYLLIFLNKYLSLLDKIEREYKRQLKLQVCIGKLRERMQLAHGIVSKELVKVMDMESAPRIC